MDKVHIFVRVWNGIDQGRFALGQDFTVRGGNVVNQGDVVQFTAVGYSGHVTGNGNGGKHGNGLADTGQDGLAAAPLDVVHVIVGITDDGLKINHFLAHVQFFHEDGTHAVQPVAFIGPDSHVHELFGTDGQTLIIIMDITESGTILQVCFNGVEHDDGQGSILVCLVNGFFRIVEGSLAADNRANFTGKIDTGGFRQPEQSGITVQQINLKSVGQFIEEIIAGMLQSVLNGLVRVLPAGILTDPALGRGGKVGIVSGTWL